MYDVIASEYGYTIPEFLSLTIDQFRIIWKAIQKRKHNEKAEHFEFHAGIHGVKYEIPRIGQQPHQERNELSEEQQRAADQRMQERLAQKKAEYARG